MYFTTHTQKLKSGQKTWTDISQRKRTNDSWKNVQHIYKKWKIKPQWDITIPITKTSYIVCMAQCKMEGRVSSSKIIKNFKMTTTEQETKYCMFSDYRGLMPVKTGSVHKNG